jgi:hypothetical protein
MLINVEFHTEDYGDLVKGDGVILLCFDAILLIKLSVSVALHLHRSRNESNFLRYEYDIVAVFWELILLYYHMSLTFLFM